MLTIIQVGGNKASNTYVRNKMRAVEEAGLRAEHVHLPDSVCTEDVIDVIDASCESTAVIVQLPLPVHIDKEQVLNAISPWQDIDGLVPNSPYKPLTPCAIMRWLSGIGLEGKNVTILGRSELVGKPLANMMIEEGATVTVCNSHTPELKKNMHCILGDIVVSAVGKPDTITEDDVRSMGGQIFIDVGINRTDEGKICGDISEAARERILLCGSEYTPVPGGVGKWTVRELVLRLAEMEGMRERRKDDNQRPAGCHET